MLGWRPKVLLWHWGRRGGAHVYSLEIAKVLSDEKSLELHLSVSRQGECFKKFEALSPSGFHVDTYSSLASFIRSSVRIPSLRRAFLTYLHSHEIDVIYVPISHLWNPLFLNLVRNAECKFLFTVHDAVSHPGDRFWGSNWIIRQQVLHADRLIALTEHVKREIVSRYEFAGTKIDVIPHGAFHYNEVATRPRQAPSGRPWRLLFYGRIKKYKGLDLLLSAFRELRSVRGDLELLIVGSGDVSPYKSFADGLPGIKFDIRWVPEDEVAKVIAMGDVLVAPYTEASQSGSVAVAFGSGVPVVATPVGGLVEQIGHLNNGVLSEEVSAAGFAKAILQLVDNPALYERCSQGALAAAVGDLSWQSIGKKIVNSIRSVGPTCAG